MTDDDRVEILAMNIHMAAFGVTALTPDWLAWSKTHRPEADALREQAREMLGVSGTFASANAGASTRTSHHHGLGWLYGG